MYSLAISPLALCCSITKLSIPHPGSWLSWPPSLSLPGSVWVWSRCFPSFRPIPSLSSPLSLMQGKCLLLFPGKKKGKKQNQTCANHFLCDRGEGILCCVLKFDPHPLTPRTKTRLSLRTRWTSLLCLNVQFIRFLLPSCGGSKKFIPFNSFIFITMTTRSR